MFRIEISPSSGHYTTSYSTFAAFYLWVSTSQLSLKLDYDGTVMWDHTNVTQWKYCMVTCHYIIPAICFVWWPDDWLISIQNMQPSLWKRIQVVFWSTIYLFFIPAEIIFQNTKKFTLPPLLIWFCHLTHTYMSFEEDPECPWDGSLAAISWYLLLTFRFNQSPTLTTGSSTSHLLILWELFGWHIKHIGTQKPHNEVKKFSIYLNWDYNASQTEKKKSLIQANSTSIYKWIFRAQFSISARGGMGGMG